MPAILNKNEYIIIPKGSVIKTTNPEYDENDASTHESIEVVVSADTIVCLVDDTQVERVEFQL